METRDERNISKRRFVKAWLNDKRYKCWIREVSSNNTLYFCTVCNKNFSCTSLHVSRHVASTCHQKNVENLNKYAGRHSGRFRPQWLEVHPWLQEVPNNINAVFCIVCKRTMPAHLGKISRHAESKMHRDRSGKNKETNRSDTNLNIPTGASLLFDERKKAAEIRLAAFIAEKNIPHQIAKGMLSLLQHIGEDPNVLKSMTISRTKCQKIISNVLYPVETERIVNNIKNTKFSIFIDETSDITNDKWMTFLVRYVDSDTLDAWSQLVKLIDIDASDSSDDKLFNAFRSEMYKLQIPFENILALSCDNASLMTEKHVFFTKKLEEKCKNLITFVCPCHSAALAALAASNKMPAFCDEFLRKMFNFINSSPKRSTIFKDFCDCFQDTSHKLLKLCDTRWLTHYSCVDRILESWDTLKHFLTEIVVSEKTQSGKYLLTLIQKLDIKAYFLFLKYVLNFFNAFNAFFQAEETRIHLLHSKSVSFLMQICKNFIKPELLADLLMDIKFSEHDNHKPIDDINLGSECEEYLLELHKEGHADVIANIRQNCLNFYVTAAEEIKKRLPLSNKFLYKLQTFLPRTALLDDNREKSFLDVSFIAKTFGGFDENGLKEDWIALYQDFTIDEKLHLSKLNFDCMWKEILKRQSDNIAKYPHFKLLLNAIRSLPNSNAAPERSFSILNNLKTSPRNRLSSTTVNATCVFKSALKTRGETALDMSINKKHLCLMSTDTLYAPAVKNAKSYLQLYADATAGPSSSDTQT